MTKTVFLTLALFGGCFLHTVQAQEEVPKTLNLRGAPGHSKDPETARGAALKTSLLNLDLTKLDVLPGLDTRSNAFAGETQRLYGLTNDASNLFDHAAPGQDVRRLSSSSSSSSETPRTRCPDQNSGGRRPVGPLGRKGSYKNCDWVQRKEDQREGWICGKHLSARRFCPGSVD
jgi:hypothetical protein